MGILIWLLIGAVVAGICARSRRYAFPTGRAACLVGGTAGGFLGGGVVAVTTGSSQACVHAWSAGAAAGGALLIVAAVGWAGRAEYPRA